MPVQGQKYVIVGGAGLVGGGVAHSLAATHSADIIICDRIGDVATGKWANLPPAIDDLWAPETLIGNLDAAWREIAGVIVLADAGHETGDGDALFETAFHLPRRIWDFCAAKQRPLFWASSAHVYANGASQLSRTPSDLATMRPTTAFGVAKRAFDMFAARQGTGPTTPPVWAGLRLSSVYGANERHKGSLASLPVRAMAHAHAGTPISICEHSDTQTRDWVHVDDVADTIAALATGGHAGFFDIGTGVATSTRDLFAIVESVSGKPLKTTTVAAPSGLPASLGAADISAYEAVGVSIKFRALHEGLAQL